MSQIINNTEELTEILLKKRCLLYCAGRMAKNIVKYMAKSDLKAEAILVTEKNDNPSEIMGIPVFELGQYVIDSGVKEKTIIVCAMEKIHKEISDVLNNYDIAEIKYVSDAVYCEIEYKNGDYELEILQQIVGLKGQLISNIAGLKGQLISDMSSKLEKTQSQILKFVPRTYLEYFIVNILDHCNLKCKGCDHFACIADPYFVPIETIKRDIARMSEILNGDHVLRIAVMGGEPLLHPDLIEILKTVREAFTYAEIRLTTNGLLLLQQSDRFWQVCREQKITIVNTKYPINLNHECIKEKAKCEDVYFKFFEGTGDGIVKKSFKKIINLEGDSDPIESFAKCHISNYGNFLMEGKFFGCPFACQSNRIFNKKFNQKLRLMDNDYLDIYKVKNMQEIFNFTAMPKPYCRYCVGLERGMEWNRSKREISEWVEE